MFDRLSSRLSQIFQQKLTADNIKDALSEIRKALLEADVALPVLNSFLEKVRAQALGTEVIKQVRPDQILVKICHQALTDALGEESTGLSLNVQPPAIILMAGLQGSGKTTTTVKLAHWLRQKEKKTVMVTSCDVYRPAAIDQLKTLADQAGLLLHESQVSQAPVDIAKAAIEAAKLKFADVLIIDTAGRLHIDDEMMNEIKQIHQVSSPAETLFVVDSMTGQDAANTAKVFNDALSLTGVVLTKVDGDARGGAALSIRGVTGKPIKFFGTGEKTDALEIFHPDRIASRILGMGDILTLVEEAQEKVDKQKSEKLAKKILKGKGFDFEDFLQQIQQMRSMGGIQAIMGKMPAMGTLPQSVQGKINDDSFNRVEAIIQSMTLRERRAPGLILNSGSRKRRILKGSGTNMQDLMRLMKQFKQMQKMMKKFGKKDALMGLASKLGGKLPPF